MSLDTAIVICAENVEDEIRSALIADGIPSHLHSGIIAYLVCGQRPGSFLCAVFANDLMGAVGRADPQSSLDGLPRFLRFIYTFLPSDCHGSPEKVAFWCEQQNVVFNRKRIEAVKARLREANSQRIPFILP